MDGEAVWTEQGSEQGLDHLAMLTPIETHYQSLLRGFSSVTTRLRNYSFYSFWVTRYARDIRHSSRDVFEEKTRRVEALYALASMQRANETGVAGSTFASNKHALKEDWIDFRVDTDLATPKDARYLAPRGGAFPGVYSGQMTEIGLIGRGVDHGLPVPKEPAERLAAAYEASLGNFVDEFFRCAEEGQISRDALEPMICMAPSALKQDSEEADLLRNLLMGEDGTEASLKRRATLLTILEIAREAKRKKETEKITEDMLRWWWVEHEPQGAFSDTHRAWQHYQVGDMTRLVYEGLLYFLISTLEEAGRPLTAPELIGYVVAPVPEISLSDWLTSLASEDESLKSSQERSFSDDASISDILSPLAHLWMDWRGRLEELSGSFPDTPGHQTCVSELRWIEERASLPAKTAIGQLIFERVLRRHFEVAARKFRFQRAYTYLIETEDARLRPRQYLNVSPSGPRLATAIRFLEDVDLLHEGKITTRGEEYLESA